MAVAAAAVRCQNDLYCRALSWIVDDNTVLDYIVYLKGVYSYCAALGRLG